MTKLKFLFPVVFFLLFASIALNTEVVGAEGLEDNEVEYGFLIRAQGELFTSEQEAKIDSWLFDNGLPEGNAINRVIVYQPEFIPYTCCLYDCGVWTWDILYAMPRGHGYYLEVHYNDLVLD